MLAIVKFPLRACVIQHSYSGRRSSSHSCKEPYNETLLTVSSTHTHYKGSHTQGRSPTIPRLSTPNRQTCICSICMLSYDQHGTNPEIRTLSNQVPLHCPHNSLTTHWKALQMLEWHRHIRSKPAYTLFDPLKNIRIVARAFSDVCTRQIAGSCAVTWQAQSTNELSIKQALINGHL